MSYRSKTHPGTLSGLNLNPFAIKRPYAFWYPFPDYSAPSGVVPDRVNGNNLVQQDSVNVTAPNYSHHLGFTASHFDEADSTSQEFRAELSEGSTTLTPNGYPITMIACVASRNTTTNNHLLHMMDPTAHGELIHLGNFGTGAGELGEFVAFHHVFSGSGFFYAKAASVPVQDRFYVAAATFTKSGSTRTARIQTIDTVTWEYENATNTSTSVGDIAGMTRMGSGRLTDTTPANPGDYNIAWAAMFEDTIDRDELFLMAQQPLLLDGEALIGTPPWTTTTVTALPNPRAGQFDKVLHTLFPDWHDQDEFNRMAAEQIDNLQEGKIRATGNFTLTASATTTTVEERRVGPGSVILPMAQTATAAAALDTLWFSSLGEYNAADNPSFVVNHDSTADTDRTYRYFVVG